MDKFVDTALASLGLAGTFSLMGLLEPRLGVKLFVPPMMASGIIFFSPATPPNPKGFISGTIGCASVSAAVLSVLSSLSLPATAAQGCAAGALLAWYKATGCIFPPAAVLCVLMAGVPTGNSVASFVAAPWVAGHACLYVSAQATSAIRAQASASLNRSKVRAGLAKLSSKELKEIFSRFDTSKDGELDAVELKVALRVALGADLTLGQCTKLIDEVDSDGTCSLSFKEFEAIVRKKEA